MGMCFSKKKMQNGPPSPTRAASSHPPAVPKPLPRHQTDTEATPPPLPQQQSQAATVAPAKKQIFGITPSRSNSKDDGNQPERPTAEPRATATETVAAEAEKKTKSTPSAAAASSVMEAIHRNGSSIPEEDPQVATTVRTSSCSKEEVESILIQCGRLSRNSSGAEARNHRSRKRSYDFDCGERNVEDEEEEEEEREKPSFSRPSPHRQRHRRTPSRDGDNTEHKRSGSRERGSGGSTGRRMSRSPGRRSDTLVASSSSNASSADKSRQPPGKMVSVPAREKTSVPSEVGCGVTVRKAAPLSPAADGGNKRGIEVGSMRNASPRTRSPANPARSCSENTHSQHLLPQQPQSLSRSSSRKAEQSPYRRNPMAEVDGNIIPRVEQPQPPKQSQLHNDNKVQSSRKAEEGIRKPPQSQQLQKGGENTTQTRRHDVRNRMAEATSAENSNTASKKVREQLISHGVKEQRLEQQPATEEVAADKSTVLNGGEVLPTAGSGAEVPNPRGLTRSRSSRRSSRDLDATPSFNPETLLNHASYASLLLEDIHNYHHHKNAAAFSLPACVSKACSILEAVADLNSSCSSSAGNSKVPEADRFHAVNGHHHGAGAKNPGHTQFLESDEAVAKDGLMKPSLRKCTVTTTATARGAAGVDSEPQESAGSNSVVGQPWGSPLEPNSADSTDRCWTSSWSNNGGDDVMGREEELISPPNSNRKYHPKQQQQRSGGFDASGRRSRSGAAASISAAAGSGSTRGRGGNIGVAGGVGNARVGGA